jgi:hypothetical protein
MSTETVSKASAGAASPDEPHRCELPDAWFNRSGGRIAGKNGPAISECYETEDGTLWVSNGHTSSRVNFCPFCGVAADSDMEGKP